VGKLRDPVPSIKFVIADDRDNVATAVACIVKGEAVAIGVGDNQTFLTVNDHIPLGHKFALTSMAAGQNVIKYGEIIGIASRPIEPGHHVHVHNMQGKRGRGDKS
jgi:altronate dehydratase small subunit